MVGSMAASEIDVILWSLNGPVLRPIPEAYVAMEYICTKVLKVPVPFATENGFRLWNGHGAREGIERLADKRDPWEVRRAVLHYEMRMMFGDANPVDGVSDTLRRLGSRFTLGAMANLPEEWAKTKLDSHHLSDLFKAIEPYVNGHPELCEGLMRSAMRRLGADPSRVAAVIDRIPDALAAQRAGIADIILVTYGWEPFQRLYEALKVVQGEYRQQHPDAKDGWLVFDHVSDSPEEVERYLESKAKPMHGNA